MKKLLFSLLCPVLLTCSQYAAAQVSSIYQNFDVSCALSGDFPTGWFLFNPLTATIPAGEWTCSPTGGRYGSPGMQCTGVYAGAYHLDTSYLISPMMNIASVSGPVYLNFDTKADSIVLGGGFTVVISLDTPYMSSHINVTITDSILPVFGVADSTSWETHSADISEMKDSGNFYITFRYTSSDTSGSMLFLDNVNTGQIALSSATITNKVMPLSVLGTSTSSQISISYYAPVTGPYQLKIYDMLGRMVHSEIVDINDRRATYSINGLQLQDGMYFIKVDNGLYYGIAKTIIY